MVIFNIIVSLISATAVLFLCYKYNKLMTAKEIEHYTDYVHGNLVLRIFKPEFEYQAVGKVPREKILDRGTFSQFYLWVLIEM